MTPIYPLYSSTKSLYFRGPRWPLKFRPRHFGTESGHIVDKGKLIKELKFRTTRSSGPGGQHVNKVSSKVELLFDIENSAALTATEKDYLLRRLQGKLNKHNVLLLQCSETRSQHTNRERVVKRFLATVEKALRIPKKRKPTKPSKSSIEKRLTSKKKIAQKKVDRKPPKLD